MLSPNRGRSLGRVWDRAGAESWCLSSEQSLKSELGDHGSSERVEPGLELGQGLVRTGGTFRTNEDWRGLER